MITARSYRNPRLGDEQLAQAQRRARHVIVLMFENRSFDHMLGFLDHPDFEAFGGLRVGEHPNPYDLVDPTQGTVGVSDDAEARLEMDPPHGHVSALTQLNTNQARGFRMDGFVAAYAQKLAGKEHIPHVHWKRIGALVALLVFPIAAAAHDLARRSVVAGWSGFPRWYGWSALAVVVGVALLQLHLLPGIRRRYLLLASAAMATFGALAAEGMARWFDERRGAVSWTVVTGGCVAGILLYVRKKMQARIQVPQHRLRELSANIMRCMTPDKLPALAELAREYAVCTRWFSSVPGATWPNRNFAHAATSDESVDIELGLYEDRTLFEALDAEERQRPDAQKEDRRTWRIYHHDTPQVFAFPRLWGARDRAHWYDAGDLLQHIADEDLPMYSFVEPCHTGSKANSQHPGNNESIGSDDFRRGDQLIASIYNALVDRPALFRQTVLVITYDEHGGLFDHVEPPRAVHPDRFGSGRGRELGRRVVSLFIEHKNRPFPFTHLGVRVPTVVVSPWVIDHKVDPTVYDHASIVATVRRLWAPSREPLSRRDEFANDFLHLLVDRESPKVPTRCAAYDEVTERAAIGADVTDLAIDEAALGAPVYPVKTGDDFADQLVKLNHLVLSELPPVPTEGTFADVPAPSSTAARFKASADSTRQGNPPLAAF